MIRILICDDHQLMLDGLCLILAEIPNINVVGQCHNGQEAIDWLTANVKFFRHF